MNIDKIIAYEQGSLDREETVQLFQELVDSGMAWRLQGHYGRTAQRLISAGLVKLPSQKRGLTSTGGDLESPPQGEK